MLEKMLLHLYIVKNKRRVSFQVMNDAILLTRSYISLQPHSQENN